MATPTSTSGPSAQEPTQTRPELRGDVLRAVREQVREARLWYHMSTQTSPNDNARSSHDGDSQSQEDGWVNSNEPQEHNEPNQKPCPFIDKLPSEIRLQIYNYTLDDDEISQADGSREILTLNDLTHPPLANVCRTIRREYLPLFFRRTEFHVMLWRNTNGPYPYELAMTPLTQAWIEKEVGLDCPFMKRVVVHFDPWGPLRYVEYQLCIKDGRGALSHGSQCTMCTEEVPLKLPDEISQHQPDLVEITQRLRELVLNRHTRVLQIEKADMLGDSVRRGFGWSDMEAFAMTFALEERERHTHDYRRDFDPEKKVARMQTRLQKRYSRWEGYVARLMYQIRLQQRASLMAALALENDPASATINITAVDADTDSTVDDTAATDTHAPLMGTRVISTGTFAIATGAHTIATGTHTSTAAMYTALASISSIPLCTHVALWVTHRVTAGTHAIVGNTYHILVGLFTVHADGPTVPHYVPEGLNITPYTLPALGITIPYFNSIPNHTASTSSTVSTSNTATTSAANVNLIGTNPPPAPTP